MKKVHRLYPVIAAFLFLLLHVSCKQEPTVKPNIIFLFADDQSYNTLPAHGNREIRTPNIDRLAREGVLFTHAYNMGAWNGAVCIASRAMINTGKFVWRAERAEPRLEEMAEDRLLWSQIMKKAGYETYFSGKWHVKIDPELIFDNVRHERPGMPGTVPEAYLRPVEGQHDLWSPSDTSLGGFWEGGKHWSEVLGDDAVDFLAQASSRDAPFFMYLAFNAPHDPRQSPAEYVDRYPLDGISLPESYQPLYPFREEIGCGENLRDERLAPFPRTEYAVKVHRREYYAIITHMDEQIGRILEALEESGKAGNTYIFFSADHGLAAGYQGLMGKQNMYDHSIRPPLIVVGPDVPSGSRLDMDVYLQDIMPSAIELSGQDIPGHIEFKSLMPFIQGETAGSYDEIYGCYTDRQRMIRKDGYKLMVYPYAERVRLYDLENDPLEMNDISGDPGMQDLVADLFDRLEELGRAMDDTLDIRSFFPEYQ